jgi:hypothetical protein
VQPLPNPPHLAALSISFNNETISCSQLHLRTGNLVFGLSQQAKLMCQTKAANAIIYILVSCIRCFALRVLLRLSADPQFVTQLAVASFAFTPAASLSVA